MPNYLQVEGEDVEFVDEDGNIIKGGEETLMYVDTKGNIVPEKNAKKLLKAGYVDSRTLFGYKIQKKPSPSKSKPISTSYSKSSSTAYKKSYSNSTSSSNSNVDLIANMKQMFAAAKNNVAVQPDINEIENDAALEFSKPRKRREKSTRRERDRYDYSKYAASRSQSYNPAKYSQQMQSKPKSNAMKLDYQFTKEQERQFKRQQKETGVMNNAIEELQRNLLQNRATKQVPTYKGYASSYVKSEPKVKTTYMSNYGGNNNNMSSLLKAEMNLKAQREVNKYAENNKPPQRPKYNPGAHFKFI